MNGRQVDITFLSLFLCLVPFLVGVMVCFVIGAFFDEMAACFCSVYKEKSK